MCTNVFSVVHLCITFCVSIWHKSARMGKILNPCHNFKLFSTLQFSEWFLCRGHLAVLDHKCWRQSKNVVHISWLHLDDQVKAFQVGVIPGILNFEVALRLICTYSVFVTQFFLVDIRIALGFLFLKLTLKTALAYLVPNQIWFPGNFYFQK